MSMPLFSRIVAAVNGSEASILAAKYAIVLAKTCGCALSAVYVVDTATIEQLKQSNILIEEECQEYTRNLEENGDNHLSFVEELAGVKGVKIDREMRHGEVYTQILAVADQKNADLIILGGWEKDRPPKDVVSHSCREIMANAKCSVLLAKEPDIDKIYDSM